MIGVVAKPADKDVVAEFFELFKTPWEYYRAGCAYDVILACGIAPPRGAALTIQYGSHGGQLGGGCSMTPQEPNGTVVECGDAEIPIYGELAALGGEGEPVAKLKGHAQVVARRTTCVQGPVIEVGFDLFGEVRFLLSEGQPADRARYPTLDLHIALLRKWITGAGIALIEIPPVPPGYRSIACLTHDVDFAGIRHHKLDCTMWGFLYRATLGSLRAFFGGRAPLSKLLRNWQAALSLPCVYAGLCKDFWLQFEKYREIEGKFRSTYFLIPFANRVGANVDFPDANRRAARYELEDIKDSVESIAREGAEIGLHGIDAWHDASRAREEAARIRAVTGEQAIGNRVHWLCFNKNSPRVLEQAGLEYDSTVGYNDAVGYRAGTTQVYRPLGARRLLEIPLHIQDVAMFYPRAMGLSEVEAWPRCTEIMDRTADLGGVTTVLWHMRSVAPERLWGGFYIRLLEELRARAAWVATARDVVAWFRFRRSVTFRGVSQTDQKVTVMLDGGAGPAKHPLRVRTYVPRHSARQRPDASQLQYVEKQWMGESSVDLEGRFQN